MNPSDNVYIESIEITNIKGIEKFSCKAGQSAIVVGENGTGKSSFLDASLSILEGGHNPELIRTGTKQGSISWKLSNGATVTKTVRPNSSELEICTPENDNAPIKAPATYLRKLAPSMSGIGAFDPAAFLRAKPREAAQFLLKNLPLTFEPQEVNFCLDTTWRPTEEAIASAASPKARKELIAARDLPVPIVVTEPITLQRLNELHDGKYDEREKVNRSLRDIQGTIKDFERSLPSQDGKDWVTERDRLNQEVSELKTKIATTESDIKLEAEKARTDETKRVDGLLAGNRKTISEFVGAAELWNRDVVAFAKMSDHAEEALLYPGMIISTVAFDNFMKACSGNAQLHFELMEFLKRCDKAEADSIAEQTAQLNQDLSAKSQELGEAAVKAEQETKASGIREAIAGRRKAEESAAEESERLTCVMKSLKELKHKKLKEFPIPGFDLKIEKGIPQIWIGDIPFHQLNAQKRLVVAMQMLSHAFGAMPLLLAEVAELDENHLVELAAATESQGIQLIVAMRVKDQPLKVLTVEEFKKLATVA